MNLSCYFVSLWTAWALVVVLAMTLRGLRFAIASAVLLGVVSLIWSGLARGIETHWVPVLGVLTIALFIHFASLTRARLRPLWFRVGISIPGLWFAAASLLAFPWAIIAALGFEPIGWWFPFVISVFGLAQSLRNRRGEVTLVIDNQTDAGALARHPKGQPIPDRSRPLTIVQITDPHLGPFMSSARLRRICQRAVALDPDLIVLTGDFLTMESHQAVDAVVHGLEPLSAVADRVFACLGNHDHEARKTVIDSITQIGGTLLIDEHRRVHTRAGAIDVIGADFAWRDRKGKLEGLFEALGPRDGTPRLLLLHDPGAFCHVPDAAADLTLSGHTHGGQVGLVSLGLNWTIVNAISKMPDHGLWAKGRNRMYVHRGTCHYGYPIRLGVPGEESLMRVWFHAAKPAPM